MDFSSYNEKAGVAQSPKTPESWKYPRLVPENTEKNTKLAPKLPHLYFFGSLWYFRGQTRGGGFCIFLSFSYFQDSGVFVFGLCTTPTEFFKLLALVNIFGKWLWAKTLTH